MTAVIIDFVLTGLALFVAGKLVDAKIRFVDSIICVVASSLFLFIPSVGGIMSIIAFFMLLKHFTECDVWPDLILLVTVSKILVLVVSLYFVKLV